MKNQLSWCQQNKRKDKHDRLMDKLKRASVTTKKNMCSRVERYKRGFEN